MSFVESKKIILRGGMGHKMQVEDLQKTQKIEDFDFHCKTCANPIKKEMYIFVLICFKAGCLRRLLQIRVCCGTFATIESRSHFKKLSTAKSKQSSNLCFQGLSPNKRTSPCWFPPMAWQSRMPLHFLLTTSLPNYRSPQPLVQPQTQTCSITDQPVNVPSAAIVFKDFPSLCVAASP